MNFHRHCRAGRGRAAQPGGERRRQQTAHHRRRRARPASACAQGAPRPSWCAGCGAVGADDHRLVRRRVAAPGRRGWRASSRPELPGLVRCHRRPAHVRTCAYAPRQAAQTVRLSSALCVALVWQRSLARSLLCSGFEINVTACRSRHRVCSHIYRSILLAARARGTTMFVFEYSGVTEREGGFY